VDGAELDDPEVPGVSVEDGGNSLPLVDGGALVDGDPDVLVDPEVLDPGVLGVSEVGGDVSGVLGPEVLGGVLGPDVLGGVLGPEVLGGVLGPEVLGGPLVLVVEDGD